MYHWKDGIIPAELDKKGMVFWLRKRDARINYRQAKRADKKTKWLIDAFGRGAMTFENALSFETFANVAAYLGLRM